MTEDFSSRGPLPLIKLLITPPAPTIACAESIALLYLLLSVPTPASPNSIDSFRIRHKGYTSSFERERSLADTFAFLSNITDASLGFVSRRARIRRS